MSHSTSPSKKLVRPGVLPWLGLAVLAAAILAAPGSAQAESNPAGIDEGVVVSVESPDYHYEAPKGSNLTYLARRSLQLETEGSGAITGAPLVAAETCLVQALGARDLIFVGEPIVVGGQLIDDCLEQTDQLTEAQLECWGRYVPIRENLDWIQPTAIEAVAGIGSEGPEVAVDFGEITDDASRADGSGGSDDGSSFSSWYWWLIAGFVFGIGWYFMVLGRTWRSGSEPESSADDKANDNKKLSQPVDDSTPVKSSDSDSKKSTNKKSKPRKRSSNKSS